MNLAISAKLESLASTYFTTSYLAPHYIHHSVARLPQTNLRSLQECPCPFHTSKTCLKDRDTHAVQTTQRSLPIRHTALLIRPILLRPQIRIRFICRIIIPNILRNLMPKRWTQWCARACQ